jgi:hypothetical protein
MFDARQGLLPSSKEGVSRRISIFVLPPEAVTRPRAAAEPIRHEPPEASRRPAIPDGTRSLHK